MLCCIAFQCRACLWSLPCERMVPFFSPAISSNDYSSKLGSGRPLGWIVKQPRLTMLWYTWSHPSPVGPETCRSSTARPRATWVMQIWQSVGVIPHFVRGWKSVEMSVNWALILGSLFKFENQGMKKWMAKPKIYVEKKTTNHQNIFETSCWNMLKPPSHCLAPWQPRIAALYVTRSGRTRRPRMVPTSSRPSCHWSQAVMRQLKVKVSGSSSQPAAPVKWYGIYGSAKNGDFMVSYPVHMGRTRYNHPNIDVFSGKQTQNDEEQW